MSGLVVSDVLVLTEEKIENVEADGDVNRAVPPGIRVPEHIARLAAGPRKLGELRGEVGGPTLICVGGIHGNEPSGALALERLFRRLGSETIAGLRGRMVGFIGNRQALAQGRRFLRHDLNRFWSRERAERLRDRPGPLEAEAAELRDLDREIRQVLAESRLADSRLGESQNSFYLLDLHTTSGDGPAFGNLDDTLPNRKFALEFPVPLVVGIEEEIGGTLTGYFFEQGAITLGFESGQHQEEEAIDRAEAAIWIALEASGVLERGARPEVAEARRLLEANRGNLPHVVEVLHRHHIEPGDNFRMLPDFRNLQRIQSGQQLASDHRGEIQAKKDGLILMPLYQNQGNDGFFLVQPVRPMWLKLSEYLRRLRLERFLHYMPGVLPNPAMAESFTIDRRYARWFALELFHLMGFRRHGEVGRYLIMARRAHGQ